MTSNSESNVNAFLQANKLDLFDFVNSEKNIFQKHKALARLLKRKHINKNAAIYVGDEIRDVEASKKIDLTIVAVSWGLNSRQSLLQKQPNAIANEPKDLLAILRGLKNN